MKPLILQGHTRAITKVKFNREGDLVFSCAKDTKPCVWYSDNGERLGTYNGHNGAVWCLDVDWQTTKLLTGSGDNSTRLWDCETGMQLFQWGTSTAVRTCGFSFSSDLVMFCTDRQMGHGPSLYIYDIRAAANTSPLLRIQFEESKVTAAVWGGLDECIITGHENGEICQLDIRSGECIGKVKEHTDKINDIQLNKDCTMYISASKDTTAMLFDADSLEHLKTYKVARPVNTAAISPVKDHVLLAGGPVAVDVALTHAQRGELDARFFHLVFEEEFGRVKGHFGPINSVAFHPNGQSYCSGGEGGFIRVHHFDPEYFQVYSE